jgi:hypothetical protein
VERENEGADATAAWKTIHSREWIQRKHPAFLSVGCATPLEAAEHCKQNETALYPHASASICNRSANQV